MDQEKNKRVARKDVFTSLVFDTVEVYGQKPNIISELTVNIVPPAFQRLLAARNVVNNGVSMAGTYVRNTDIKANVDGYHLGNVCLFFLPPSKDGGYLLSIHCCCHTSGVFITAYKDVPGEWFEEQMTRYEVLDLEV